jgi:serine/threonine-protein kinase
MRADDLAEARLRIQRGLRGTVRMVTGNDAPPPRESIPEDENEDLPTRPFRLPDMEGLTPKKRKEIVVDGSRYELHRVIGLGGYAEVHEAAELDHHGERQTSRLVAVKVLRPEFREDEIEVRHMVREAELLMRLGQSGHRAVVRIFAFDPETELGPAIVMEMLSGRTLSDHLKGIAADAERGRETEATFSDTYLIEALGYLVELAEAIAKINDSGIVHRDIKPENVFLESENDRERPRVVLFDLGIARDNSVGHSTGLRVATPRYASPEVVKGGTATPASDQYGFGVIAYELLEGRHIHAHCPQTGDVALAFIFHLTVDVPVPKKMASMLWPIVAPCLDKEPSKRHENMNVVAKKLRDAHRRIKLKEATPRELQPPASATTGDSFDDSTAQVMAAWQDGPDGIRRLLSASAKLSSQPPPSASGTAVPIRSPSRSHIDTTQLPRLEPSDSDDSPTAPDGRLVDLSHSSRMPPPSNALPVRRRERPKTPVPALWPLAILLGVLTLLVVIFVVRAAITGGASSAAATSAPSTTSPTASPAPTQSSASTTETALLTTATAPSASSSAKASPASASSEPAAQKCADDASINTDLARVSSLDPRQLKSLMGRCQACYGPTRNPKYKKCFEKASAKLSKWMQPL